MENNQLYHSSISIASNRTCHAELKESRTSDNKLYISYCSTLKGFLYCVNLQLEFKTHGQCTTRTKKVTADSAESRGSKVLTSGIYFRATNPPNFYKHTHTHTLNSIKRPSTLVLQSNNSLVNPVKGSCASPHATGVVKLKSKSHTAWLMKVTQYSLKHIQ